MGILEYDELKLRLEKDAGSYRVLAFAPDGSTGRGAFTPPFAEDELDEFVEEVGQPRQARRGYRSERMEKAKQFGSQLFDSLIKDQVGEVYLAARAAAQAQGRGLRITLYLSGAPDLMGLPWELLYRRPRFLSQSEDTPLVRSLDFESTRPPRKVELPLRILGLVSSPMEYPELDADEERGKLDKALSELRDAGLVELYWLERATLGELRRRIAEPDEIHVLHFIGHGAYDEGTEAGIVVLENERGRAREVTGEEFGSMLQNEKSLRLVVLNSCEGGRGSAVDPFSGAAASLVEFEIPAVIGMQFEITDKAAIAFSGCLYTALAQGLPVDAALAQARLGIFAEGKETEFATPVLFLRSGDARLFDVPNRPQPPPEPLQDRPQPPPKPPPEPLEDRPQPPPKPPLPRTPTWRLILEGVIVAGLAALVARSLAPDIKLDIGAAGEPSRFITSLIQVRGLTWAVAGAALGIWLAFRVRAAHDYVRCALLGLFVGVVAGALGGAIFGFPVAYLEDQNRVSTTAQLINVGSFAVTGALIGALIGGLWRSPRVAAGLASGGVAAALAVAPFVGGDTKEWVFCLNAAAIAGAALVSLVAIDAKRLTPVSRPPGGTRP